MSCKDALAKSCSSDLNLKTTGISDVKMPGFHFHNWNKKKVTYMHTSTFRFNFLLVYQLKLHRGNSYEPLFVQNTTILFFFFTEKFQIWEKHLALPKTSITTVMQCQLGQMGAVQSTLLPPPQVYPSPPTNRTEPTEESILSFPWHTITSTCLSSKLPLSLNSASDAQAQCEAGGRIRFCQAALVRNKRAASPVLGKQRECRAPR